MRALMLTCFVKAALFPCLLFPATPAYGQDQPQATGHISATVQDIADYKDCVKHPDECPADILTPQELIDINRRAADPQPAPPPKPAEEK